ncbi:unnamed protein product, partial [Strongylus vulgaris]
MNSCENLENLPRVESPESVGSESHVQEISAGPIFEEPHHSREVIEPSKEKGDVDDRLAVVPVPCASSATFKVPLQGPSRGSYDDAVELTKWSIRFAPIGCDGPKLNFPKFILLGYKRNHSTQWRSSIVIRVESAEILHTSSTKYRLVGNMNIIDSAYA